MKRNPTFFVNWDVCRWTVAVAGYEKSWVTLCGFCQPHRSAMGTLIPVGPVFELSAQPNLQRQRKLQFLQSIKKGVIFVGWVER